MKTAIFNAFYELSDQKPEGWKRIFDFTPVSSELVSAGFSGDGKYIYGWTLNREIKTWSSGGKELLSVPMECDTILHVRLSACNRYIGVLSGDRKLHVISSGGSQAFLADADTSRINNRYLFDFSSGQEFFVALARDREVFLLNGRGETIQKLIKHNGKVNAVDISPDDRFIATASSDSKVYIWALASPEQKYFLFDSITGHTGPVRSCVFNDRSNYILTSSDDSTLGIWNLHGKNNQLYWYGEIKPAFRWSAYHYEYLKYLRGKQCDARFSAGHRSIVGTSYFPNGEREGYEYRHYIIHDRTSQFYQAGLHGILDTYLYEEGVKPAGEYLYLETSPGDDYVATVVHGFPATNLVLPGGLPVMTFRGVQPVFSPDGKTLLCMEKYRLHKYVIDIPEMRRLVFEDRIFGEPEPEYQRWITY